MPLFTHTEHDIQKDADNDQIKDTQITVDELNEAKRILKELLSFDVSPVDELVKQCHLSIPVISTALFEMELSGDVVRHYGNRVSLVWSPDADTEND
jgi:predicted Rossmann fold nucleotide-binding protein DprA/Smf involved in DNA uptake